MNLIQGLIKIFASQRFCLTYLAQDIDTHSPISGNFEVTFENDCAKMNFSLDLQYDEQDRLDRTFGLQVFLSGLGSNSNKKKFNNRCGG